MSQFSACLQTSDSTPFHCFV